MQISNNLKKILISCSALLMIASVGAGANNVSAHRVHHRTRISRITKRYNNLIRYVDWVNHYNHTHKHNWSSYKISHLNKYLHGLNHKQKKNIYKLFQPSYSKRNYRIVRGTRNDYKQGEKAGNKIANIVMKQNFPEKSLPKVVPKLIKISSFKLFNKEYINGFIDTGNNHNDLDDDVNYDAIIKLAQQYKASHYNRTIMYIIKKVSKTPSASGYMKHHKPYSKYKSIISTTFKFINTFNLA